jgi:MIP family channel proteins
VAVYAAELVGTFGLVFAITATAVAAGLQTPLAGTPFGSLSIALVNGIVLAAMVAAVGHVSGAHLNPAVTIGLATIGRFRWRLVPGYLGAQLGGGVLAGLGTWAVEGDTARGAQHLAANSVTHGISDWRALITEILITFLLVFVVTAVTTDPRVPPAMAPVAIGAALSAAVFIGGPITGAAVNPARALGPMIVAGSFAGWWIFLIGPLLGGLLGAGVYDRLLRSQGPATDRVEDAEHRPAGEATR